MLKKVGMVAVGSMAGLVALAPIASATECHDGGHHHGKSQHHGGDKGKHVSVDDHSKNKNASKCDLSGGGAGADGGISGDSFAGNVLTQAPIGGSSIGNIGNCSNILQDNLNGNKILSDFSVDVL